MQENEIDMINDEIIEDTEIKSNTEVKKDNESRKSKNKIDLFPGIMTKQTTYGMTSPAKNSTRISIFNPINFNEALDIVECLRERGATTICLESMKNYEASRLVDFVSGASKALDGDFIKLSDYVYLFSPSNIKITEHKEQNNTTSQSGFDFLYKDSINSDKLNFNKPWLNSKN